MPCPHPYISSPVFSADNILTPLISTSHIVSPHPRYPTFRNTMEYPQLNSYPNFKEIDSLFLNRLRQFTDEGQYKQFNLPKFYVSARMDHGRYDNPDDGYIEFSQYAAPNLERPPFNEVIPDKLSEFKKAKKGDSFGPGWKTFWFEIKIRVPSDWTQHPVMFNWDCGNEALIYDEEGLPIQALTGGTRTEWTIPDGWSDNQEHRFFLEMACNRLSGAGDGDYFRLSKADLFVLNAEARALFWDFWIIGDAARELANSGQKYRARTICNDIMDAFNPNDEASIVKCREIAAKFLGGNFDKVFSDKTTPLKVDIFAVGNCHIDTAWLWPFAETKRKIVRSWTSQLRIMEKYPDYQFVASQAQQFDWLKKSHPEIFKQIKQKVSENQFIPIGGSWVENDTNLTGGESLLRQFLLGQRFFMENFGFQSNCYWLPDTFGYSSQIPQLCRLANMPFFLTQKLSWNNINRFPSNSFNWVALDGSQVMCHMPPADTYTAKANFGDVKRSLEQHHNLSNDQTALLLYGYGDGGGGPTEEMIEKLRRCRGMTNTVGGPLPIVKMGCSIDDFYTQLQENTENGSKLPSWKGELYLEFHRGTYTTQAEVKKMMRTCENLLYHVEYLSTWGSLVSEFEYPLKRLNSLWQQVCLCQFHDVLPGSCIEMVYRDEVKPMLKGVIADLKEMVDSALESFPSKGNWFPNTLGWERSLVMQDGTSLSLYHGSSVLQPQKKIKHPSTITEENSLYTLSNHKLKATINENGVLTSLVDLVHDREIIETSGGNRFVIFDDEPLSFPAWDTELYSLRKFWYLEKASSVEILEDGPLRSSLKVKHSISKNSFISTVISLDGLNSLSEKSMLQFQCEVDWHESYKFLKVEFPVSINQDTASYETQFGITKRPTHFNTSWDTAKFEVCQHRFADYSDFNYGVSIINDSKYGMAIHGNLMRLSLLRAPKSPDRTADMDTHYFEYAILPHKGPLGAETVKAAIEFNDRLARPSTMKGLVDDLSVPTGGPLGNFVLWKGDQNVIVSNVKRGEDDSSLENEMEKIEKKHTKSVIVRVYESLGGISKGILSLDKEFSVKSIYKCNALEERLEEPEMAKTSKNSIHITLRGFEVASYCFVIE